MLMVLVPKQLGYTQASSSLRFIGH